MIALSAALAMSVIALGATGLVATQNIELQKRISTANQTPAICGLDGEPGEPGEDGQEGECGPIGAAGKDLATTFGGFNIDTTVVWIRGVETHPPLQIARVFT